MNKDTIYREDAIRTIEALECFGFIECKTKALVKDINAIPSADRPQGDVDAVAIFMREMHSLEQGYITIGEFDERLEPLRHLCYGRPQGWIPCSERLPEDSGDYLVCPSDSVLEDYSDFSEVMIMPYDADCEAFGWWVERYHPISLGYLDSDFNEFEVLAWMPLPDPWKGTDDDCI